MASESIFLVETQGNVGLVPQPSHRHAAPCAPWPWIDLGDDPDAKQLDTRKPPIPAPCDHSPERCNNCWTGYPQSRFPNWTEAQVIKAKIYNVIHDNSTGKPCVCYRVDVDNDGCFQHPKELIAVHGKEDIIWRDTIHEQRPQNTRLRALFIENLSGPVLQMLGTKYNIEPFFWSSSLTWTPSRFQEEIKPKVGDHITITLTFIHSMPKQDSHAVQLAPNRSMESHTSILDSQSIDTQSPLLLNSNKRRLVLDLLSVHLVRNINGSTIISYHPTVNTTAKYLHDRIRFAGQSVYWQSMFQKSPDPTFVLLTFIWHAMYAWDEALEHLYQHICCLESQVISTADMALTRELHAIRAHHLHYLSLLNHYTKHVLFIKNTPNPAMDAISKNDRLSSRQLLYRECDNLMNEIERLISELNTQERRLKNVMDLVFSSVNIADSRAMKQISYLTMVFLPATFATGFFGMNVVEINPGTKSTIFQYIAVALSLTAFTTWIIITFQSKYLFRPGTSLFKRLAWPFYIFQMLSLPRERTLSSIV